MVPFRRHLSSDMLGLGLSITKGSPSGLESAFSYLLDSYPSAAAAYSLRKLSSSYSGSAVRVRRESNNEEQDIGFSNNELDTAALATFCSGTNGFVTTWYDQANSNDATQTTHSSQPKIYDSSTGVLTENGKPAVAPVSLFGMPTGVTGLSDASFFIASINTPASGAGTNTRFVSSYAGTGVVASDAFILRKSGSNYQFLTSAGTAAVESTLNENLLLTAFKNGSSISVAKNGGALGTATTSSTITEQVYLLDDAGGTVFDGARGINEVIIYNSDQSGNRSGIEDNINDYYNIY